MEIGKDIILTEIPTGIKIKVDLLVETGIGHVVDLQEGTIGIIGMTEMVILGEIEVIQERGMKIRDREMVLLPSITLTLYATTVKVRGIYKQSAHS